MAGFFGKIMSYIANELIVKSLAENRSFQRFALRTDNFFKENIAKGEETLKKTINSNLISEELTAENLKSQIEKVNIDIIKFQREGNLSKVAELKYGTLPPLESKLKEKLEPISFDKYLKKINDHIFDKSNK